MVLLVLGANAAKGLADGDPASDVLVAQPAFVPADATPSSAQTVELQNLLAATARARYPLRVAIIASSSDLGSVTELWRQPQAYAQFLAQELPPATGTRLLVVMPGGYGLYDRSVTAAAEHAALARLEAASGSASLVPAAVSAIQRLASAAGHPVSPVSSVPAATPSRSSDTLAWLVFALGALAIGVAWAASLRARPPALPRGLGRGRQRAH